MVVMADDDPIKTDDPEGGAGGDNPPAPSGPADPKPEDAKPDIGRLLTWDEERDGELPEELKPLANLKDDLTSHVGQAIASERQKWQQEQDDRDRRIRQRQEQMANAQQDLDWLNGVEAKRDSTDSEEREAAKREIEQNGERYQRAWATKYRSESEQRNSQAVAQWLSPQFASLPESFQDIVTGQGDQITFTPEFVQRVEQSQGSVVKALIDLAFERGDQAGYERGMDEGQRNGRIEDGKGGAPSLNEPRKGDETLFQGIDRSEKGSGAEMMRRALRKA